MNKGLVGHIKGFPFLSNITRKSIFEARRLHCILSSKLLAIFVIIQYKYVLTTIFPEFNLSTGSNVNSCSSITILPYFGF